MAQRKTAAAAMASAPEAPPVPEQPIVTLTAKVSREVEPTASVLMQRVQGIAITTEAQANVAAALLSEITVKRKAVEEDFEEPVKTQHAAWKALTTLRGKAVGYFAEPERILRGKIGAWDQMQEDLRQKAEAAAERERQQKIEQERQAQAAQAEADGDTALADAIRRGDTPDPVLEVATPVPQGARPLAGGVSSRPKLVAEVVDKQALIRAAAGPDDVRRAIGGMWAIISKHISDDVVLAKIEAESAVLDRELTGHLDAKHSALLEVTIPALNRLLGAMGEQLSVPGIRISRTRTTVVDTRRA